MRPKNEAKFKEKNWYINEPFRSIVGIKEGIYNAMLKVFALLKKSVEVVISGVDVVLDLTSTVLDGVNSGLKISVWILKNLPYILTGGVVLFI